MKDLAQAHFLDSPLATGPLVSSQVQLAGKDLAITEIRTVIAGPETQERKELRYLLESEPGFFLLADCSDTELEGVIRTNNPDLVVLDIRTPDATKSPWSNEDPEGDKPVVVCVAATAEYAPRAFAVRAIDLLVKPLDAERFHQAMERVRRELSRLQHNRMAQQMINPWRQPRAQERPDQLVFRVDGRLIFVDLNDIDWIGASANYVRLNAGPESYLVRESIGRLSARLDRERFVRIHRSVIVNVRRIKELQSCNAGEYIAVLKNGKKLPCSRGFRAELERYISSCIGTASAGR